MLGRPADVEYRVGLVTGVGPVTLTVPRTRQGFTSQVFERYCRRQAELNQAIGEMFVKGASPAPVGEIVETLTGITPSPTTVSRVHQTLPAEFDAWKQRPLLAQYLYLFAAGPDFTVIYDDEGQKTPGLAVIGITPMGTREVVAVVTGDRENQQAWTDRLTDLQQCGLQRAGRWITDSHPAMLKALAAQLPETPRQRCVNHKLANVLSYVPKTHQAAVEPERKAIFYQTSRAKAEQLWSFTGLRRIGLIASSPSTGPLDARFDNFALYPASCGASVTTVTSRAGGFEMGKPEVHRAPVPLRKSEDHLH